MYGLLTAIPAVLSIIVFVVGVIFAFVRRAQLGPRASAFTVLGLGVLFLNAVLAMIWPFAFTRMHAFDSGLDYQTMVFGFAALNALLHLVGLIFLISAVFAGRAAAPPMYPAWPAAPGLVPPTASPFGPSAGPATGPSAGPLSGPPAGPPSGPPAGPAAGPSAGPPAGTDQGNDPDLGPRSGA